MHKYWGKKPANDLRSLIEKYTKEGDMILDPFSGYGVFCCEAFLLNRNVITNDLNPIANYINKQLLEQDVSLEKLQHQWLKIKEKLTPFIKEWFEFTYQKQAVQLINVLRDKNDRPIKGRFRLEGDSKTKEIQFSSDEIDSYLKYEESKPITDWFPDSGLIENSRISAKKGMKVSDLFTKRTLACHSRLFALIESESNGNERELLKLAFTANLANCSRLVPPIKTRGEMSQGAWMTGFYVGETYIENNVLLYFENRLNKLIKGKKDYLSHFQNKSNNKTSFFESKSHYYITQYDAKDLKIPSESVDYVFTDPPYGDAVPYFEQSIIWNAWLNFKPDYANEIVVSDSKERNKNFWTFEEEIDSAFSEIRRVLKLGGIFSLTYHSLSGLEWRAITNACIKNGFELLDFQWLVQKTFTPRQINRAKSVKGDVLVSLEKAPSIESIIMEKDEIDSFFTRKIEEWLTDQPLDTNEIFIRMMKIIFSKKILIKEIDLLDILTNKFKFTNNQKWVLNDQLEFC